MKHGPTLAKNVAVSEPIGFFAHRRVTIRKYAIYSIFYVLFPKADLLFLPNVPQNT